jgi:NADP-dependent 3-hydroxy acid dehydrogenase YdfG
MAAQPIIIFGYGPGISAATARRFGREGFPVALVGRSAERLAQGVGALEADGIRARAFPGDAGNLAAVREIVRGVRASLGAPAAIHWNAAGTAAAGDLLSASRDDLGAVLDVAVHGLLAAVKEALPDLRQAKGAVLITGGGLALAEPGADALAVKWGAMGLALAKAAQHKLAGLLHERLAADGVFVGEVLVRNIVKGTRLDNGRATLEPATVAEELWKLYRGRAEVSVSVS